MPLSQGELNISDVDGTSIYFAAPIGTTPLVFPTVADQFITSLHIRVNSNQDPTGTLTVAFTPGAGSVTVGVGEWITIKPRGAQQITLIGNFNSVLIEGVLSFED